MTNPNKLATLIIMSHSQSIHAHDANRRIAYTNRSCTIMRVTQQNKLTNIITTNNLAAITVELCENPNLLTTVERTSGMDATFTSINKWLEPIERIFILERRITRPHNTKDATVSLTVCSTMRNRNTVNGLQILQSNFPIQTGSDNSIFDANIGIDLIAKTVPRGSTNKHHLFNSSRHI